MSLALSRLRSRRWQAALVAALLFLAGGIYGLNASAHADGGWGGPGLRPGNLLLFTSTYQTASITPNATALPAGCTAATAITSQTPCNTAQYDGTYPTVFNNDTIDGSFGVTSPISLDELNPHTGNVEDTISVPTSELVTSFSSKSEGAINLSTSDNEVSFMGYVAPVGSLDVSNSSTPGEVDPTNSVIPPYYRAVATLDRAGHFHFTETNAYGGNNGRASIVSDKGTNEPVIFTSGNAGNGLATFPPPSGTTQFPGVVLGAGAQSMAPSIGPEAFQSPGTPTPVGSFSITLLGDKADKIGKDDNFRGLTIYNNVLYYSKGSGGNGVNTVYFLDTTGKACPNGVGVPQPGAALPTSPLPYDPASIAAGGPLTPYNMCILKGFPTVLAKSKPPTVVNFPFGIFFANKNTVYVADEGSGDSTYSASTGMYTNALPANNPTAGLEKWVFDSTTGQWNLAYTITNGLDLGNPYLIPGYPTGNNSVTGKPWAPATDGLRNITGRVNENGTVTIWAESSTVSGSGDQGADPNKLFSITDKLDAATLPSGESFTTVDSAASGQVFRGISFTPGTHFVGDHPWFGRRAH
jgi:hypothetical protein